MQDLDIETTEESSEASRKALPPTPTQQARACIPLGPIDYAALNYFLQGRSMRSISEELGVGTQRLNNLLSRPAVKSLFEAVKNTQKQQLEIGAETAVQSLNELMLHADAHIRLGALDKWFKVMGWYNDKLKLQVTTGAEEVAAALIRAGMAAFTEESEQASKLDNELVDELTED